MTDEMALEDETDSAEADEIRAMRREAEGLQDGNARQAVNQLADQMEHELDGQDTRPPRLGGDVGGDYDGLMLTLERIESLGLAINDVVMTGERRNVISLCHMIGDLVLRAEGICEANSKAWGDRKGGAS